MTLRASWSTERFPDQPSLHIETLSQNKTKQNLPLTSYISETTSQHGVETQSILSGGDQEAGVVGSLWLRHQTCSWSG